MCFDQKEVDGHNEKAFPEVDLLLAAAHVTEAAGINAVQSVAGVSTATFTGVDQTCSFIMR